MMRNLLTLHSFSLLEQQMTLERPVPEPWTALEQQALEQMALEQPVGDLIPGMRVLLPYGAIGTVYEMYELAPGYVALVVDTAFGRSHIALRPDDVLQVCL